MGRNMTEDTFSRRIVVTQGVGIRSHISILYTNAHILIPKCDELSAYFAVEKPDVITITEIWAVSKHLILEF